MVEIIDAYSHLLPEAVLDELLEVHPHEEVENLKNAPQLTDVDKRLNDMDEYGVDKQVLTIAHPPIWQGLSDEDCLAVTKLANDEIRRLADEYPDKFIPAATLPRLTGGFVDEAERALNDLDMVGVQTFSHIDGQFLDDPRWIAMLAAVLTVSGPISSST